MSADHEHGHAPANVDRTFGIGIGLNIVFVAIEAFYGWKIDSLALLADAAHNLSDVIGLVLAWGGTLASRLRPDARHTYGWERATILTAFINALLLLVAMGSLAWEAMQRLQTPQAVEGVTIMVVAGIGILVNSATALLFMSGRKSDLNIRGAFLRMAADALVSAGVVVAGGLAFGFGWTRLDPVVSLLIAAVILVGTWSLFKQSLVPEERHRSATHDRFGIRHVTIQVLKVPFTPPCATLSAPSRGRGHPDQTAQGHDPSR